MAEYDPLVRFNVIAPVIMDLAGSRAAIVEGENPSGNPLGIETIADGVAAKSSQQNVNRTDALCAMQRKDGVAIRA